MMGNRRHISALMVILLAAHVAWGQAGPAQPDLTATPIDTSKPPVWEAIPSNERTVPANPEAPIQVNVAVKVVEFQTTKGVETGLSAYFAKRGSVGASGTVTTGDGIRNADITFPLTTGAGITVFLDRLRFGDGDIEAVLQALVNESRLFILSRPNVMVTVGSQIPSIIKTVKRVPYEKTAVVGATMVTATEFRETGVSLKVTVPQVIDDDGNWNTTEDTYVMLTVEADVTEEGERLVVALAGQTGSGSNFISVPELVTRSIRTSLWVRNGQVLIMGGLYRNTKNKNLVTVPWLTQTEDLAAGLVQRVLPIGNVPSPVSATLGNRSTSDGRRELVFLIKADMWQPSHTIVGDHGFTDQERKEDKRKASPSKMINDLIEGITEIPHGIAEGIKKDGTNSDGDSEGDNGK